MQLKAIFDLLDTYAPFALSNELCKKYDCYDNSGIIIDCKEEIKGILFALDCNHATVESAKELGANLIVTHHPVIYTPVKKVSGALLECAMNRISVVSCHLNLDCAQGGVDESLMNALGGNEAEAKMWQVGEEEGYGRIYSVDTTLSALVGRAKSVLHSEKVVVYGEDRKINKVASFCGAGLDEESVSFALSHGADVVVSSDSKHHVVAMAVDSGLSLVVLTHYASEQYGLTRFYEKIKKEVSIPCELFTDERFL